MASSIAYRNAVVLEYDDERMIAPELSAKGEAYLADEIVKLARKYKVPIVERPEISRSLLLLDEGTSIPEKLYKAVATILNEIEKVVQQIR